MTSQLDITLQHGKPIAKHLFICVSKLVNGMAPSYIWGDELRVLCVLFSCVIIKQNTVTYHYIVYNYQFLRVINLIARALLIYLISIDISRAKQMRQENYVHLQMCTCVQLNSSQCAKVWMRPALSYNMVCHIIMVPLNIVITGSMSSTWRYSQ